MKSSLGLSAWLEMIREERSVWFDGVGIEFMFFCPLGKKRS